MVRAPAWGMQVLKVLGLNPAAVYWLLGLCATGVLRPVCNWEQLGAVIAVWYMKWNELHCAITLHLMVAVVWNFVWRMPRYTKSFCISKKYVCWTANVSLRHPLSRRSSPRTECVLRPSDFIQPTFLFLFKKEVLGSKKGGNRKKGRNMETPL